jgi:formate dehydrogenase major subunit
MANSDCIIIEGSNMAECHPVGFQWVMEAKARGATVIHVDPRFTRTSAMADIHVRLRSGSDIAFLGGLINYVLSNKLEFREYVVAYTNAPTILRADFEDADDLGGLFSGYDAEGRHYDQGSWQYEGVGTSAAAGSRAMSGEKRGRETSAGDTHGGHGATIGEGEIESDPTLEHPRCVFQVLKRHYARYTPEMVERVCGIAPDTFLRVAEEITRNSGRERTTAFAYAVGWTHQTKGVQIIRAASILQLLLGNMGRPGGGIMALRGHASIQGSTDISTLFNTLPGYIPSPEATAHPTLEEFVADNSSATGFWGNMRAYTVSLLKAWWGDAATAENDFCFDYIPKITGDHGNYQSVMDMIDGKVRGYFLWGENPAVGTANGRMQRKGLAALDWLVVRDNVMIDSASFWKDGPEVLEGEWKTEDIGTEVFFMPAATYVEKDGSFTNTQRLVQWHSKAVEPPGDCRSDLHFAYHLGRLLRERLAASTDERDRPLLDLTWDYPTEGPMQEPNAEAVLAEISGYAVGDRRPLGAYTELTDDGATASGCWIYCGAYAEGVNQAARRKPGQEQNAVALEWAWAWPNNRRLLYNRASADPEGRPWSERKKYVWWDAEAGKWTGEDVPDFEGTKRPDYIPPKDARAQDAISGTDPFVMQADGRGWLYAPSGLVDGPLPTHYEPQESPIDNPMYKVQSNPTRELHVRPENPFNPSGSEPGSEVYPFVLTTFRLTEHHTAGGMSRTLPFLSELMPEMFVEVSPQLAEFRRLEHAGWATIVTARSAIEARVLVTPRMAPLTVDGRVVHQIGLPYHWGGNGLVPGDSANDLLHSALDANVHIMETKASTADIIPGRRPRGPALRALVEAYQRRAGITKETGTR